MTRREPEDSTLAAMQAKSREPQPVMVNLDEFVTDFAIRAMGRQKGQPPMHTESGVRDEDIVQDVLRALHDKSGMLEHAFNRILARLTTAEQERDEAKELLTWTLDYIDPFKHVACDIYDFLGLDAGEKQAQFESLHDRAERTRQELTASQAEVARLREALGVYADRENWMPRFIRKLEPGPGGTEEWASGPANDGGEYARTALSTPGGSCRASFTDRNDEHRFYECGKLRGHTGSHEDGDAAWTGPTPEGSEGCERDPWVGEDEPSLVSAELLKASQAEVARLREALMLGLDAMERHAGWCGYNKDAPGDYIHVRFTDTARAALSTPEGSEG